MIADYHIHCEFSDDSVTPMEKQIERGIEVGLDEICFTEHVDYGVKKDWTEGDIATRGSEATAIYPNICYLANANYPEYFGKLIRMKAMYGDKISIKNGLEFGVQKHTIPKFESLLQQYGDQLDFILLSIHQVDDQEFWTGDYTSGKEQEEYNRRYYEEMLYCAKHFDGYDVLAHIDLISRYDPAGIYPFENIKDILEEIFKVIIEKGKGIEFNTSSWRYQLDDTTPSRDILKLYHAMGGDIITIGSDAHKPEYVGAHFQDGLNILKEIGFKKYYTYDKHRAIAHTI